MKRIVRKEGIASVKSSEKSISVTGFAIITPTRISAEAVAAPGMEAKSGVRNREMRNRIPVTIAVRPVLPPATTPAEDSTKVVTVDVPNTEPTVVPIASDNNASPQRGTEPSGFNKDCSQCEFP